MHMKKLDLHNEPKITPGFKIPEAYFDCFEDRLMQKLAIPEKEEKVVRLWQRQTFWLTAVAAVFSITLGIWMYFNQTAVENNTSVQEYLAYQNDITAEDIALHLTHEDILALETELNSFDYTTEKYINESLD